MALWQMDALAVGLVAVEATAIHLDIRREVSAFPKDFPWLRRQQRERQSAAVSIDGNSSRTSSGSGVGPLPI